MGIVIRGGKAVARIKEVSPINTVQPHPKPPINLG
jgi:hypothetical protein